MLSISSRRGRATKWGVVAAVASLALSACVSSGSDSNADDNYPTKSITLTIPYAPGGGTDTAGRLIGAALEKELGESVVVVNKEGGGGSVGVGAIASSKADGYNLGISTDSNVTLQPYLNKDLKFDQSDFTTWNLAPTKFVLVAAANSKYTTLTDIITEAKANPGKVRIAHPGTGGSNDFTARAFGLAAGIDIVPVPITGGGAEINKSVASGQVELAMTTVPVAKGFIDSGDLVVAGTIGTDPAPGAEDAETLAGIGVDISIVPEAQLIFLAPAGLSDHVVDAISKALKKATDGELGEKMAGIGFPMVYGDPATSSKSLETVQKQYEEINEKFKSAS